MKIFVHDQQVSDLVVQQLPFTKQLFVLRLRPALLSLRAILWRNRSIRRCNAICRRNVSIEQDADCAACSGFVDGAVSNERFTGRENALVGEGVGHGVIAVWL